MGKETAISWTDHTFNPWWGCVRVSEGCTHCYAETFSKRTGHSIWGVDADRRFFGQKHWNEPLLWNSKAKKQELVFCASMADVFETHKKGHINDLMNKERERLGWTIWHTPNLEWLLLTKRIESAEFYLDMMFPGGERPDSIWVGCTTENQESFDKRIEHLANVKAKVRFLSVEPQIGPVSILKNPRAIDWVISGGESGPGCRPFDVAWARQLRDECKENNIAFFLKQLGGHPNKRHDLSDFPEDLRIQEFPKSEQVTE